MQITEDNLNLYLKLFQRIILLAGCIIALILLSDYLLPGQEISERLSGKSVESNQRYSGRYSASAYKVFTPARTFYVERDFFIRIQKEDTVKLVLSPFFNAVNAYQCEQFMPATETFSLRLASGLLLPLSMLILSLIHTKFRSAPIFFLIFISFVLNCITLFTLAF